MDYEKLGFKAGIEIHQELDTKKLFCQCSTAMHEDQEKSTTQRKIRAVAGETGEIDQASGYEQLRNRSFIYHAYKDEACLVDLDEEPPHPVQPAAFTIALQVAKMFKLTVPDTICVMRKTVTDGSAVSGFQRTMLIGMGNTRSYLDTEQGKVQVDQLNLEEDASKIIEKKNSIVHYSLSRLGIPLLEIGTDPSLKNPGHVKETAEMIGTLLRSFPVKRGIGTIRQDVNVSIEGGARIEVKGWQDLHKLELLVDNEVSRQKNLLEIKQELENRGLKKFKKQSAQVTDVFKKTSSKILLGLIKKGGKVYALMLPKFADLLKKEVCLGKTFGKELSEYAKAYGTKGMIHTDEDLAKYKLTEEFKQLRKQFKAKKQDLIIIIAEHEEIAKKAVDAVYERALYCLKGVPEETRIPNHHDATSSYARPLPGAKRMYPETDIPNIEVSPKMLEELKLPELLPEKIKRIAKEYKIDKIMAKELCNTDFEKYVDAFDVDPEFIAQVLINHPKEIKKRYSKEIDVERHIEALLSKVGKEQISKDAVFEIMVEIAQGKKVDYATYEKMDDKELAKHVRAFVKKHKTLPLNAVIGKVMGELRGKAPGKKIVELIRKYHE